MTVHVLLGAVAVVALGCGDERPAPVPKPAAVPHAPAPKPRVLHVKRAACRAAAANCAAATGRIVYVEAHDPDGDGDLHLVVVGGSVTLPGMSVFDIEKELRPRRVPKIGDLASAAGPVYRGSYGQKQIQATELHIAYR